MQKLIVACFCLVFMAGPVLGQTQDRVLIASGSGTLTHTPKPTQNYQQNPLDCTSYRSGDLVIEITMGSGACAGSFDLFSETTPIPTMGRPKGTLSGSYDRAPKIKSTLRYHFRKPGRFIFCADGNWYSQPGTTNTYTFSAYVENGVPAVQSGINNHLIATEFSVNQWKKIATIEAGDSKMVTVNGDQIALVASSDAGPLPTLQFYFKMLAMPKNKNGSLQDNLATPEWYNPVEYSSRFTGIGHSSQTVIQANATAPKQQWTISIPPQADTHDNSSYYMLTVYAKVGK